MQILLQCRTSPEVTTVRHAWVQLFRVLQGKKEGLRGEEVLCTNENPVTARLKLEIPAVNPFEVTEGDFLCVKSVPRAE